MHTIFLFIGRSGCGKSTLANLLTEYGYSQLPSFTTRPMRKGETEGVDHTFITAQDFHVMHGNGQIAASTFFNGNYYGASKKDVLNHDIYIIDKAGLIELQSTMGDKIKIVPIYIKTSMIQLINRMLTRGDSCGKIVSRLVNDFKMFHGARKLCDFVIKNKTNNVNYAFEELKNIMNFYSN